MKKWKKIGLGLLSTLVFSPLVALAQAGSTGLLIPPQPKGLPGQYTTATTLVLQIINIALAVVGIVAILFIVIGGFRYITSAGNEEAAESGKKMITNAIIGLVVVILSYVIIRVIMNALAYGLV